MTVEQILAEITSVFAYEDPVHNDWVAAARTGKDGCRLESRKNGTREGAVASAIMGLFAQRVNPDGLMGIARELAEEAASRLNKLGRIYEAATFPLS